MDGLIKELLAYLACGQLMTDFKKSYQVKLADWRGALRDEADLTLAIRMLRAVLH